MFTTPHVPPLRDLDLQSDVHWNQVCATRDLDGLAPHDLRRTLGSLAELAVLRNRVDVAGQEARIVARVCSVRVLMRVRAAIEEPGSLKPRAPYMT